MLISINNRPTQLEHVIEEAELSSGNTVVTAQDFGGYSELMALQIGDHRYSTTEFTYQSVNTYGIITLLGGLTMQPGSRMFLSIR